MINKAYIASSLLTHVLDESNCFSNTSPEYSELRGRLLIIHAHLNATESALRVIERIALGGGNEGHALQRIHQISSDYLGAAESAEQMLDDINACLEYLHWNQPNRLVDNDLGAASDDELDELLGKLTRSDSSAPAEQQ